MKETPARRTTSKGLRIYVDQRQFIELNYGQNCSALVRMLLDKYMQDKEAQLEFESFLKKEREFKEEVQQLYDEKFLGKTALEPEERG